MKYERDDHYCWCDKVVVARVFCRSNIEEEYRELR